MQGQWKDSWFLSKTEHLFWATVLTQRWKSASMWKKARFLDEAWNRLTSFVPPSTWILYIHPFSTVGLFFSWWESQREIMPVLKSDGTTSLFPVTICGGWLLPHMDIWSKLVLLKWQSTERKGVPLIDISERILLETKLFSSRKAP